MLDTYIHDGARALCFRLAGELVEPDAAGLEQAWKTAASMLDGRELVVDLTGVERVDKDGERVLRALGEQGARFVTASELTDSLARFISHRQPETLPSPPLSAWARIRCWLARCCGNAETPLGRRGACDGPELKVW